MRRIRTLATAVLPVALLTTALTATPALAGDDDVLKEGPCSGASDWKLKGSPDDGRLEVEFEVDSNKVGQSWAWKLFDNDVRVGQGTATTTGPSGSFEVHRRVADRAGKDVLRFRASNAATGELCRGSVTLPA